MLVVSDKADIRVGKIIKYKERFYTMIKRSIFQDITILDIYGHIKRVSNYVRQKLIELQRKAEESTIIVGDFNSPLSEMNRSSRQKVSKDITKLNRPLINWI